MKRSFYLMLLIPLLLNACQKNEEEVSIEKWKKEIVDTEKAFADMAQKEGIPKAFLAYAAEEAVLMRNNTLIRGKEAIRESFDSRKSPSGKVQLTWKPDFVEVASSGDLGYTYGKYVYTSTDSTGNEIVDEGVFHTVWKRQPDGNWKFVWD